VSAAPLMFGVHCRIPVQDIRPGCDGMQTPVPENNAETTTPNSPDPADRSRRCPQTGHATALGTSLRVMPGPARFGGCMPHSDTARRRATDHAVKAPTSLDILDRGAHLGQLLIDQAEVVVVGPRLAQPLAPCGVPSDEKPVAGQRPAARDLGRVEL
jgi:hypothetical protein